ncbi:MAG: hypothetical protein EU550_02015, partial [Promethearchaeota archaeon]
MVIFAFIVNSEQYMFQAMITLLNLSRAIIKKGHQINGIFFYGSGVHNLRRNINIEKSMKNLPEELEEFCLKNNVQVGG